MAYIFAEHSINAAGKLLAADKFQLMADSGWNLSEGLSRYGAQFIARAESLLDTPYPMLDATLYLNFSRTGNRVNFEGPYFRRRDMLMIFTLAELAEQKGRFTDRIVDGAWHIMEESTWILPAHNYLMHRSGPVSPLPNAFSTTDAGDDIKHMDLFAATTGATMAVVWKLTPEILDPITPIIRSRLLSQLKQRILHPFYNYDYDWWMGASGNHINNWAPWIVSNVLTVLALCEDDNANRELGVNKAMQILDRFTRDYPSDGGCDEGPGYWNVAGASYFDCLELLYDLSGGKIDVFDDTLVNRICEYIMNFHISGVRFVNFADASSRPGANFRMIGRMGRRLHNQRLADFAAFAPGNRETFNIDTSTIYRGLRDMQEQTPTTSSFVPHEKIWYDGLQVAITRDADSGMFLALKGGNNNESHNHNDVGQFILFEGDKPVILDAGVEQYTRKTFSPERYTLWAMRGAYHNIPEISGIEQKEGAQYRAETVSYDEKTGALTLELKNAYPADAHIDSYRRTAVLEGSTAVIYESIRLTQPGAITFHYLAADEPVLEGNTIRFATGHVAEYDASLSATVDAVDLENGKIGREWERKFLYRVNLTAKEPISSADYTLTIRKV